MIARFLLIDGVEEQPWRQVLAEALAPLGELMIETEENTMLAVVQEPYDIVVIDATTTDDITALIHHIRTQSNDTKLVVVTASPTWRRARSAFHAGATDYVRKSLNILELRTVFEKILAEKLPAK